MSPGSGRSPTRRIRFDRRQPPHRWHGTGPGRSGRRVILAALAALAVVWATLFALFLCWLTEQQARARFGAREVAILVDPLADRPPPGVDPAAWWRAVADTHAMLVAVTGTGLLDRPLLEALRADLAARVARATPETARTELARLWDEMETQAGPLLTRRPGRPPYPPRRPALLRSPG